MLHNQVDDRREGDECQHRSYLNHSRIQGIKTKPVEKFEAGQRRQDKGVVVDAVENARTYEIELVVDGDGIVPVEEKERLSG